MSTDILLELTHILKEINYKIINLRNETLRKIGGPKIIGIVQDDGSHMYELKVFPIEDKYKDEKYDEYRNYIDEFITKRIEILKKHRNNIKYKIHLFTDHYILFINELNTCNLEDYLTFTGPKVDLIEKFAYEILSILTWSQNESIPYPELSMGCIFYSDGNFLLDGSFYYTEKSKYEKDMKFFVNEVFNYKIEIYDYNIDAELLVENVKSYGSILLSLSCGNNVLKKYSISELANNDIVDSLFSKSQLRDNLHLLAFIKLCINFHRQFGPIEKLHFSQFIQLILRKSFVSDHVFLKQYVIETVNYNNIKDIKYDVDQSTVEEPSVNCRDNSDSNHNNNISLDDSKNININIETKSTDNISDANNNIFTINSNNIDITDNDNTNIVATQHIKNIIDLDSAIISDINDNYIHSSHNSNNKIPGYNFTILPCYTLYYNDSLMSSVMSCFFAESDFSDVSIYQCRKHCHSTPNKTSESNIYMPFKLDQVHPKKYIGYSRHDIFSRYKVVKLDYLVIDIPVIRQLLEAIHFNGFVNELSLSYNSYKEFDETKVDFSNISRIFNLKLKFSRIDTKFTNLFNDIGRCIYLKSIDLSDNCDQSNIRSFLKQLRYMPLLQLLNFNRNNMGDDGIPALARELPKLCCLSELYLSGCEISPKAINVLFNSAKYLTQLIILDISFNFIKCTGLSYFCENSSFFKRLQRLNMKGNTLSDESIAFLTSHYNSIKKLHYINLSSNLINKTPLINFCDQLDKVVDRIDIDVSYNLFSNKEITPLNNKYRNLKLIDNPQS